MKSSRRNFLQHSLMGSAGLGLGIASTTEVRADPVPHAADPEVSHELLRKHAAIIPGDA